MKTNQDNPSIDRRRTNNAKKKVEEDFVPTKRIFCLCVWASLIDRIRKLHSHTHTRNLSQSPKYAIQSTPPMIHMFVTSTKKKTKRNKKKHSRIVFVCVCLCVARFGFFFHRSKKISIPGCPHHHYPHPHIISDDDGAATVISSFLCLAHLLSRRDK